MVVIQNNDGTFAIYDVIALRGLPEPTHFFDVIWTLQISTGKTMISRSIWINTLSNISKLFQNNTRGIYPKFPVETI